MKKESKISENVIKSYNEICEEWYEYRKNKEINKCIVEFTKYLSPNSKILDIGCGTGYPIDDYLTKKGYIVTGIDISENMIKKAKSLNLQNAEFIISDFLEFKTKEKFDAIIAFDSLWHISHMRQKDIYKIVSSLLNDNGYFLFTHGKEDGEITGKMFNTLFYYSALSIENTHKLLKDNGFNIIYSIENYKEETTGTRDLIIVAKK